METIDLHENVMLYIYLVTCAFEHQHTRSIVV